MLESGLSGSVRGVPSNGHPYRDPRPIPEVIVDHCVIYKPLLTTYLLEVRCGPLEG